MDQFFKYLEMKEDALLDEIEVLNKRMFKMKSGPMREQMMQVIQQAQQAYAEQQMRKRVKTEDTVMEIGAIESEVINTKYDSTELLNIMVDSYTSENKNEKHRPN